MLLKLLLLLLDLELLVLLQVPQVILWRFLLRQDRMSLQVLASQMIEFAEERLLPAVLLRPQRLAFLLQSVQSRWLLYQAQLHLRVGGLRRNAQQNGKHQPLDHGAPIRCSHASTVVR